MAYLLRVSLLASTAVVSALSMAQSDTPPIVKIKLEKSIVSANKPFKATLNVTFASGLHSYQNPPNPSTYIPLTVKLDGKVFKVVSMKYPKGSPIKVAGEDKPVYVYSGQVQIPITFMAPKTTGSIPIKLTVSYQQCNDRECYPPTSLVAKSSVIVASKIGKTLPPPTAAPKVGG